MKSLEDLFLKGKVDLSVGPDSCWIWRGRTDSRFGQGLLYMNDREVSAHRISYMLAYNYSLESYQRVSHSCKNNPCVNPAHLYLHRSESLDTRVCLQCEKNFRRRPKECSDDWNKRVYCNKKCSDIASGVDIGSTYRGNRGYITVKIPEDDPHFSMSRNTGGNHGKGWILSHRYNMAKYLGRNLFSWETVHHIDKNPANNDITNLQLRIGSHGSGSAYQCADCGSDKIYPVPLKGE